MADLRDIQTRFSAVLRSGKDFSAGTLVATPCPLNRGVEVYRNNYRGNLHDTLAMVYPVTQRLVGAEFFRFLVRHFIAQYPARSGNLHHYGAEMPLFLSGFEAVRQLPYLPDMASLEWAYHRAYYAPNSPSLDRQRLSQISPENYEKISLQRAVDCCLIEPHYPVYALWKIHQDAQEDQLSTVNLESGAEFLLVLRPHREVEVKSLQPSLFAWLSALTSGQTLGTICDEMGTHGEAMSLEEALKYAILEKVVTGFSVDLDS